MWKAWGDVGPYDAQGALSRFWQRRLEEIDLDDVRCWDRFVYARPVPDVSTYKPATSSG